MHHSRTHGFTLIELLVVISIIGVLSSIVLASLTNARSKGADSAIKSNLNNIRSQAELSYDNGANGYQGACTFGNNTDLYNAAKAAAGCGGATCGACANSTGAWSVWVQLKTVPADAWCVDYKGSAKTVSPKPAAPITSCP
ncbi:MAG: type II secretion system protein [Patescibacteria group bacterium]